jgi:L-arabinose isomerase
VGVVQLTGAFRKMGKSFDLIVGTLEEEAMYRKAADYARIVMVRKKLRFLNLGIIGHTFQGMYDLELDKTKLKSKIGANVNYIEVGELIREWEKIKDSEVGKLADHVMKSHKIEGPDRSDVENACRLGLAMDRIAEKYHLDGMSHLCQHLIHVETGTTPCFAVSHLIESGIMVTCEGDIGNIISMCILHYLTNSEAVFVEWGMFDVRENAMLMVHHGAASPRMASHPEEASLTPTGEKWGFKGKGASFRFVGRPGYVTILSLINDQEGWKMLITGGEAVDTAVRPYYGQQFMVKMDRPIKSYLENLCKEGVTHHAVLAYGDVREDLEKLADLMDLRTVHL